MTTQTMTAASAQTTAATTIVAMFRSLFAGKAVEQNSNDGVWTSGARGM
jgi:hypothetical protein